MNASTVYIVMAIVTLAIIVFAVIFLSQRPGPKPLSPLAGLAFGFILAGILFGENQFVGYGLMGVGVLLAIADMVGQRRNRTG